MLQFFFRLPSEAHIQSHGSFVGRKIGFDLNLPYTDLALPFGERPQIFATVGPGRRAWRGASTKLHSRLRPFAGVPMRAAA